MPNSPEQTPSQPASRAEKMSILSTMLGPDVMARIRDAQVKGAKTELPDKVEVDSERAVWHRNKLLERLRRPSSGMTPPSPATAERQRPAVAPSSRPDVASQQQPKNLHLDARLSKIADADALEHEHPAVVARLLKTLSREERVEVLKSLPGPMARSIVKRLR